MLGFSDYLTNDNIFVMTSKTIKDLAQEGPCVFIGRCADYVLEDLPNCFSVFIHADFDHSIKRIMARNNLTEKEAITKYKKTNKKRANYYNFYSEKSWSDCASYDMSFSSSHLGVEGVVAMVEAYVKTNNLL